MEIDKNLALERTLSRMICSSCGTSYNTNVAELRPRTDGICDKCGHTLKVRSDDNKNTFLNRFDTYLTETNPLINYYEELGILRKIEIHEKDWAQDRFNEIKNILN